MTENRASLRARKWLHTIGARRWFYHHSPSCLQPHGVMRETDSGYRAVVTATYANDESKRDAEAIAEAPELIRDLLVALDTAPPGRVRLITARNELRDAIVELRGGHSARTDKCDGALAALAIAIDLAFVSTTAAPPAHKLEARAAKSAAEWICKARQSTDPPQDCDWPYCGCDPYAQKVLDAIEDKVAALMARAEHAENVLSLVQPERDDLRGELQAVDRVMDRRDALAQTEGRINKILLLIKIASANDPKGDLAKAEAQLAACQAERDRLKYEWSVMAVACGNWRDFGMTPTPEMTENRRLISEGEYQCAARAFLERDALTAKLAEAEQARAALQTALNATIFELRSPDSQEADWFDYDQPYLSCDRLADKLAALIGPEGES